MLLRILTIVCLLRESTAFVERTCSTCSWMCYHPGLLTVQREEERSTAGRQCQQQFMAKPETAQSHRVRQEKASQ